MSATRFQDDGTVRFGVLSDAVALFLVVLDSDFAGISLFELIAVCADFILKAVPARPEVPEERPPGPTVTAGCNANLVRLRGILDAEDMLALAEIVSGKPLGYGVISHGAAKPLVTGLAVDEFQTEGLCRFGESVKIVDFEFKRNHVRHYCTSIDRPTLDC